MLLPENLRLGERYREKYAAEPSKYVFYGYYAMKFISDALVNYGVYFQNGYKNIGNIDSLFDYRKTRENKHLVIYRLVNGRPVVVLNNQVK